MARARPDSTQSVELAQADFHPSHPTHWPQARSYLGHIVNYNRSSRSMAVFALYYHCLNIFGEADLEPEVARDAQVMSPSAAEVHSL